METRAFEGSVRYDFWSVYLKDGADDPHEFARATQWRRERRLTVGVSRGVASIATAQQWNAEAPVSVLICERFASDESAWDHVVEFDFDCRSGTLAFAELDGPDAVSFAVPIGEYRARWSGRGFDAAWAGASEGDVSPDSYRLELVRRSETRPLVEIRRWRGFDEYGL